MASTIPAAKAAMKAALEAHIWPVATPEIRWGGPTESEDFPQGGELVYFGDTEITDEQPTLGATRVDETFSLRVIIDVIQFGDDEQTTEQRAWDLYSEVQHIFEQQKNPALGGAINRFTGNRRVRQTNIPLPQQWLARIIVDQECVGLVFNP